MRRSIFKAMVLVLSLSSCGVPTSRDLFVPNPADAKRVTINNGCVKNGIDERAFRKFGGTTVRAWLVAPDKDDPNAQLVLKIDFITSAPPLPTTSVDASRIRLEDGDQVLVASLVGTDTFGHDSLKEYTFRFAPPSGVSDKLRLTFRPGALKIGGRSIPYAPIRFSRVTEQANVSYLCIPV